MMSRRKCVVCPYISSIRGESTNKLQTNLEKRLRGHSAWSLLVVHFWSSSRRRMVARRLPIHSCRQRNNQMKALCQTKYESLTKSKIVLVYWNDMIFSDICNSQTAHQNIFPYHILCNNCMSRLDSSPELKTNP